MSGTGAVSKTYQRHKAAAKRVYTDCGRVQCKALYEKECPTEYPSTQGIQAVTVTSEVHREAGKQPRCGSPHATPMTPTLKLSQGCCHATHGHDQLTIN